MGADAGIGAATALVCGNAATCVVVRDCSNAEEADK
jgi:hypothetical protein